MDVLELFEILMRSYVNGTEEMRNNIRADLEYALENIKRQTQPVDYWE